MKRCLLLLAIPFVAAAQLQLFVAPQGVPEQPVSATYDLGIAYAGDTLSTRFRIRNVGTATVALNTLNVSGTGFRIEGAPSLPHTVAPGSNVDFTVQFRPTDYGYFSANLQINAVGILLRASGSSVATFFVKGEALQTGSTIDFGRVERGSRVSLTLEARNTTREPVAILRLAISGIPFSFPSGNPAPLYLPPGESAMFSVEFAPTAAGIAEGSITIDRDRVIRLAGSGIEPPMPRPVVTVEPPVIRSGEQGRVIVGFAQPSRARGKGTLRMEFRPADGTTDNDSALRFIAGQRNLGFNVSDNRQDVSFDGTGQAEATFQAGTTAGTLVFIVETGGYTEQVSIPVAPEAVRIDTAKAARSGSGIEVNLSGFDNARTASEISFSFFTASGQPVAGSPVRVNSAAAFRDWWQASTLGGTFALRAQFPVTGDVYAIAGIEVQIVNSVGTAKTARLAF